MDGVKVDLSEERVIGWLVMAAQQWASDYPFVMPPAVAMQMIQRGWMSQELKPPGSEEGEEFVAASFTPEGLTVVREHAFSWGVEID